MPEVATRVTRVDLTAARTILDGSFIVYGIVVANKSAAVVDVEFTDLDDVAVASITVPADDSFGWDTTWLADNGLKVGLVSADVIVTVAHSADGI